METEERCVQSDLPTSMCAHCRPPAVATVGVSISPSFAELLASSVQGKWFTAQYPGLCAVCGETFAPGEEIRATGTGDWQGRVCCGDGEFY